MACWNVFSKLSFGSCEKALLKNYFLSEDKRSTDQDKDNSEYVYYEEDEGYDDYEETDDKNEGSDYTLDVVPEDEFRFFTFF